MWWHHHDNRSLSASLFITFWPFLCTCWIMRVYMYVMVMDISSSIYPLLLNKLLPFDLSTAVLINIGLHNGLMHDGIKPLPKPVLAVRSKGRNLCLFPIEMHMISMRAMNIIVLFLKYPPLFPGTPRGEVSILRICIWVLGPVHHEIFIVVAHYGPSLDLHWGSHQTLKSACSEHIFFIATIYPLICCTDPYSAYTASSTNLSGYRA